MIVLEKDDNWIAIEEDQTVTASSEPYLELANSILADFEDAPFPDIYIQKGQYLEKMLGWEILYHGPSDDLRKANITESMNLSGRQKAILERWKDYP